MDTRELYEIVKDLPPECLPMGLVGWNLERGYPLLQVPTMGDKATVCDIFLFPRQAALLFEASMAQWLLWQAALCLLVGAHLIETCSLDGSMHFAYLLPYDDEGKYIEDEAIPDPDTGHASRPTRVEALAAAVLAVASRRKART